MFDFLHLFRRHLGDLASEDVLLLPRQLTEELVDSTGAEGLLAHVHVAVLNGVIHKGGLTPTTWQAYLALKARYEKVLVDGAWQPLFKARKREEAYAYCHLPAMQRCVAGWRVCGLGGCVGHEKQHTLWGVVVVVVVMVGCKLCREMRVVVYAFVSCSTMSHGVAGCGCCALHAS